jgi:thiamine pyrophosphate-dependent acetolactate synthase large subunit-like protein
MDGHREAIARFWSQRTHFRNSSVNMMIESPIWTFCRLPITTPDQLATAKDNATMGVGSPPAIGRRE